MPGPTITPLVDGAVMDASTMESDFATLRSWLNSIAAADIDAGVVQSQHIARGVLLGFPVNGFAGELVDGHGAQRVVTTPYDKTNTTDDKVARGGFLYQPSRLDQEELPTPIGQALRLRAAQTVSAIATIVVEVERPDTATSVGPYAGSLTLILYDRATGERVEVGYQARVYGYFENVFASGNVEFRQTIQTVHCMLESDQVPAGMYDLVVVYDPTGHDADVNGIELCDHTIDIQVY